MSPTLMSLGIDRLSAAQRILLVEEIWDSIADEMSATPLTDAQQADLKRRLTALETNSDAGSNWDQVKARLKRHP